MKSPLFLCFFLLCLVHPQLKSDAEIHSLLPGQEPGNSNPILPGFYADPTVVQYEGVFYLYATLDPWGGETLGCWTSEDFVNWTFEDLNWPTKAACTSTTSKDAMVWAPSVVKGIDGKFYMYVSVGSEVWVGGADHPLGPWRNLLEDQPLITETFIPGYHMIDAEAFIDDDGQAWLYWGSGWNWVNGKCWVVALEPDMKTFAGEVIDVTPTHYFEAPFMVKRGGTYYLMYSDGKTTEDTYQVHYVMGDSPKGPFIEAENSPILVSDHERNVLSPGHHTVVEVEGEHYILYHRHSIPFNSEEIGRQICIEKLNWNDLGLIDKITPTHDGPSLVGKSYTRSELPPIPFQMRVSSTATVDHAANFASDRNYATLWKPSIEDRSPWVEMDLLHTMNVGSQLIRFEYAWKHYAFTVQYSKDGKNWKVLEDFIKNRARGSPIVVSTPVNTRYLRLQFKDNPDTSPGIFEWNVSSKSR